MEARIFRWTALALTATAISVGASILGVTAVVDLIVSLAPYISTLIGVALGSLIGAKASRSSIRTQHEHDDRKWLMSQKLAVFEDLQGALDSYWQLVATGQGAETGAVASTEIRQVEIGFAASGRGSGAMS